MPSYNQRESGLWNVRFRVIEDGKVVNKRLSGYKTRKAAQKAYVEFMANYTPTTISNNIELDELKFNDLYNYYMVYAKNRVKESTLYDIKNVFYKHIEPYLGNRYVSEITKIDIFNWQALLDNQGYSYKYKSKIRGYVSVMLEYAVKYFDLPTNVVKQVDNFKNKTIKQEMQVWSFEEFKQFIELVQEDIYKTLFLTLYFTGCRKGEALALTWNDIDFNTNTLNINKSLTRKSENSTYSITTPKNNSSVRKILLPKILINALQELKQPNYKADRLIFSDDNGYPLAENTITRKFKHYTTLAGVKEIRIHDLRHSHASLLISQGESIVMVAKRLGHANIEQTLNTYSHMMPKEEQKLVAKLNSLK